MGMNWPDFKANKSHLKIPIHDRFRKQHRLSTAVRDVADSHTEADCVTAPQYGCSATAIEKSYSTGDARDQYSCTHYAHTPHDLSHLEVFLTYDPTGRHQIHQQNGGLPLSPVHSVDTTACENQSEDPGRMQIASFNSPSP